MTAAQLPLRGPRRGARPRMILRYPTHTCSHAPCLRWVFLAPSQAILSVRASQEDPLAATFPPHEEIVNVWLGSSHTGGPHPETTDDEIALCHAEGGFGNMPSSSTGHPLPTLTHSPTWLCPSPSLAHRLTRSHAHTLTRSHPHTLTPSHPHILTPSHPHTLTPLHPRRPPP